MGNDDSSDEKDFASLLSKVVELLNNANGSDEILDIGEASVWLRCSEDTLRRRPDLPAYKVGKRNLYLREDVLRFLRTHCRVDTSPGIDDLLDDTD